MRMNGAASSAAAPFRRQGISVEGPAVTVAGRASSGAHGFFWRRQLRRVRFNQGITQHRPTSAGTAASMRSRRASSASGSGTSECEGSCSSTTLRRSTDYLARRAGESARVRRTSQQHLGDVTASYDSASTGVRPGRLADCAAPEAAVPGCVRPVRRSGGTSVLSESVFPEVRDRQEQRRSARRAGLVGGSISADGRTRVRGVDV